MLALVRSLRRKMALTLTAEYGRMSQRYDMIQCFHCGGSDGHLSRHPLPFMWSRKPGEIIWLGPLHCMPSSAQTGSADA